MIKYIVIGILSILLLITIYWGFNNMQKVNDGISIINIKEQEVKRCVDVNNANVDKYDLIVEELNDCNVNLTLANRKSVCVQENKTVKYEGNCLNLLHQLQVLDRQNKMLMEANGTMCNLDNIHKLERCEKELNETKETIKSLIN
jgi:hypothetical protein